jgi:hypothetical protein
MKTSYAVGILAIVVIVVAAIGLSMSGNYQTQQTQTQQTQTQQAQAQQASGTKFQDSPDYKNAYLISGDALSADAQKALTGFDMQKQVLADGSTQITLNAINPEYQDQVYTLKPGQQLYFIESYLADDNGAVDNNPMDDHAIVVDSNGYLVA